MKKIISIASNILKYRIYPFIQKTEDNFDNFIYSDLGVEINGELAPKVLMIIPTESVDFYIQERYEEALNTKMHNIYFQFLALIKIFVDKGYRVDCIKKDKFPIKIDSSLYKVILDEGNTIPYLNKSSNQIFIYYCTGLKWNRWNDNEITRINWFYDKYNINVRPSRFIKPVFSDNVADYILYKGIPEQMYDFNQKTQLVQLAMPVEYEPNFTLEQLKPNSREYVWIGGWGSLFKGIDLAVEAFKNIPNSRLHIFGSFKNEPQIFEWISKIMINHPNISYHGYADFRNAEFQSIINNCVGHVYPSAGENGCATLAQTAHYGLIPISTETSNNQANFLGYNISSSSRQGIIDNIISSIHAINSLSPDELFNKRKDIMIFAKENFTRKEFVKSVENFISKKIGMVAQ